LENLKRIAEEIRAELDEKNQRRDAALKTSRETIRMSANAIRAVHREEFDEARTLLDEARRNVVETKELLKDNLDIYYAGYVQDAQKEYSEGELTLALVQGERMSSDKELGVECAAYLNGLGEAIGELRRHVLDLIRLGKLERAEQLLTAMDDVYYVLVTFDYPDAITGGLRRTTDMVRGVLERTRGDLTVSIRQKELEHAIASAVARIQDERGSASS
jgi:translin